MPRAGQRSSHTLPEQRGQEATFSPTSLLAVSGAVAPAEPRAPHGHVPTSQLMVRHSAAERKQAEECWAIPASGEHRQYWFVTAPSRL